MEKMKVIKQLEDPKEWEKKYKDVDSELFLIFACEILRSMRGPSVPASKERTYPGREFLEGEETKRRWRVGRR